MGKAPSNLADLTYFKKVAEKQVDIGRKAAFLINTGNMVSNTGLDLMQASGFTVVADKINYMRFMSHFRRCVHSFRAKSVESLLFVLLCYCAVYIVVSFSQR